MTPPPRFDFAVVGAGIAGAGIAYELAARASVLVVEAEAQAGYHSTGRSAALYAPSYGPPPIRALTLASRAFFDQPPPGFAAHPLLTPRGALFVAFDAQETELDGYAQGLAGCAARRMTADAARTLVPVLRRERVRGAVLDPGALDIDTHALHSGLLRGAKARGAQIRLDGALQRAERLPAGGWRVTLAHGRSADAGVLVNAAGAWGDEVAARAGVAPLGLEPRRRSAFVFDAPAGLGAERWPMVMDLAESFYLKPDAGALLGSPANQDPVPPHDVQAEELDIALGIDRIQQATTLQIRRPRRVWAGLRTFSRDGSLVGGYDRAAPDFFWAVGQGGYGLQSAPAAARLFAALALREAVPESLLAFGLDVAAVLPGRFGR